MRRYILFVIILFGQYFSFSQDINNYYFEHLTVNQGLSDNIVYAIVQDNLGYIYFGTEQGVDRFNGFNVEHLQQGNEQQFSYNIYVSSLAFSEKPLSTIWIGTLNQGLLAWDINSGTFTKIPSPAEILSLFAGKENLYAGSKTGITCITYQGFENYDLDGFPKIRVNNIKIKDSLLYAATEEGLYIYDLKKNKIISHTAAGQCVTSVEFWQGKTVFGTNNGVFYIKKLHDTPKLLSPKIKTEISALLATPDNELWIGTQSAGLINYTPTQITFLTHNPSAPYSISNNNILSLYYDNLGNLWVGTYLGGVNRLTPFSKNFFILKHSDNQNSTSSDFIQTIYEDSEGNVWIGTADAGLNKWDRKNNKIIRYAYDHNRPDAISDANIKVIYEDSKSRLWIGTDGGGLNLFDSEKNKVTKLFKHNPDDPGSISSNRIWAIAEDANQKLWIGTFGGGLNLLNDKSLTFDHFKHSANNINSLICDFITTMYVDNQKRLWIGTINGLDLLNPNNRQFIHFLSQDSIDSQSRWVNKIIQSSDGKIWVATRNGLISIDPQTNKVKHIYSSDFQLDDKSILNIVEDNNGNLWLTSVNHVLKYDPQSGAYHIFSHSDGFYPKTFIPGTAIRTKDGLILLGTTTGISGFDPDKLMMIKHPPTPVVEKSFIEYSNNNIDTEYAISKDITIKQPKHKIRFELGAIDLDSKNVKYIYKLEGYDKDWKTSSHPTIEYENLPPKKYVLKIRAVDDNGNYSKDITEININVAPQIWTHWWFRYLWIILPILTLIIIALVIFIRVKHQHRLLNEKVEQKTRELEKANRELKLMFEKIKKQNEEIQAQNEVLRYQNAEIEAQKEALENSSRLIREKNDEIQASIRYAVRIQKAIFPNHEQINKIFQNYFILFMPRDIISGDFYWVAETPEGKIAVVGDSTGHGIPGGFMSILGISILNKIVKEWHIYSPARILTVMRKELLNALIHDEDEDKPYDGMDLSLVRINYEKKQLTLAAANHTIYLVNPGEGELLEIKGDKMPIGLYEIMKDFTEKTLDFFSGQIIYMFTDGYPDQFGGPHSKKFKYSRFKDTLLSICNKPMKQQKNILLQKIVDWMNYPDNKHNEIKHEQIDDILIFGIKL